MTAHFHLVFRVLVLLDIKRRGSKVPERTFLSLNIFRLTIQFSQQSDCMILFPFHAKINYMSFPPLHTVSPLLWLCICALLFLGSSYFHVTFYFFLLCYSLYTSFDVFQTFWRREAWWFSGNPGLRVTRCLQQEEALAIVAGF